MIFETLDGKVLREQVKLVVSWLEYPELERLVVFLLRALKYKDVQIVDGGKQRGFKRIAGVCIMARHSGPIHDCLAIVQVKQRPIPAQVVDDIRGAMLRTGASESIVFTTDKVGKRAKEVAETRVGKPVDLVSGYDLADLLIANKLGVRNVPVPPGEQDKLVLDNLFFDLLSEIKP